MLTKLLHTTLWILGLLYGLLPVLKKHTIGSVSPYLGESYFGYNILISLGCAALGATCWGAYARWLMGGNNDNPNSTRWMSFTVLALASILALGYGEWISGITYLTVGITTMVILGAVAISFSHIPLPNSADIKKAMRWLKQPRQLNSPFFIALFGLLLWHNYQLISNMLELDGWHKFSLFLNRFFTQLSLIGALYFCILLAIENAPRIGRISIWFIASIAPAIIIVDQLMHVFWNRTFLDFTNGLGFEGFKEFETELAGGGIHLTIVQFLGIVAIVIAAFCILTYLCAKVSHKWRLHAAPAWAMALALIGFVGATAEQAIGKSWKTRRNWMQEYQEFGLQVSPVRPALGLAEFNVTINDHLWQTETESLSISKTPDIYLVLIESLRADALTAENTPFLHQFATEDAQPIGHTWAASNGTHLSWFSLFTGQVAIHRETSRDQARLEQWPGLKSFQLLKEAGYSLHMRAASELAFRDMGAHFLGEKDLFSTIRENVELDPMFELHISERERLIFEDLKSSISARKNGENFDIITIDSSHYKYSWHEDFTPPHSDYYPHSFFPASPSDEELRLIKNQYFNALAWADHLAEDFCDSLKQSGKYDDSIIIFVGDHGEEFQDHGGWLHVSSLEDEQVKVPMLIKWPKNYGRGPEHSEASHLDLMPSLLDYLTDGQQFFNTAGVSLLAESRSKTSITTTAQGGVTQEALLLTRNGYKAYFTWPSYFNGRTTDRITLTRIVGPEGDIMLENAEAYKAALKEYFPDAFEKFFTRFELRGSGEY